jgi:hypothetical protein
MNLLETLKQEIAGHASAWKTRRMDFGASLDRFLLDALKADGKEITSVVFQAIEYAPQSEDNS